MVVISGVTSPLKRVVITGTLLITPLITTHEPPSISDNLPCEDSYTEVIMRSPEKVSLKYFCAGTRQLQRQIHLESVLRHVEAIEVFLVLGFHGL